MFGTLGLLGMHLTGYGCAGSSAVAYGLACLELEAADSGVRSLVSVQGSLAMYAIWRYGSEEQKQEWLPRMAAGDAIGCFGLTEPDHGSDPGSMPTRARRDGDDWVLTGGKMWITNAPVADVAVVWAGTAEGVRGFVVPTTTAGFAAREIQPQDVAARLVDRRDRAGRRAAAGLGAAARGGRPARAAVLPDRGAVRHRLGCAGRGPGLPVDRAALRRPPANSSAGRSPGSS